MIYFIITDILYILAFNISAAPWGWRPTGETCRHLDCITGYTLYYKTLIL